MAVRGRTTAGRNMHVNEAIASCRVFSSEENRISVAHQSYMWLFGIVRLSNGETAPGIIRASSALNRGVPDTPQADAPNDFIGPFFRNEMAAIGN